MSKKNRSAAAAAMVMLATLVFASALTTCSAEIFGTLAHDVDVYINKSITLTIVAVEHGKTEPSGTLKIPQGKAYGIKALPDDGYRFAGWETLVGDTAFADRQAAMTTITLPNGNASIKARFDLWKLGNVTFTPPAGLYQNAQTVILSSATEGASIYYTLDGSEPDANTGTLYTAPLAFNLNTTTTLKSVAIKAGMTSGDVSAGVYRITGTVAAPVFSPEPGSPQDAFSIFLSSGTAGAQIRYTLDGTVPSPTTGLVYDGNVALTKTATVRAIACKDDWLSSAVVEKTYTVAWARSFGDNSAAELAASTIIAWNGEYFLCARFGNLLGNRVLAKLRPDSPTYLHWAKNYPQNARNDTQPAALSSAGLLTIGGVESYIVSGVDTQVSRAALFDSGGLRLWSNRYVAESLGGGTRTIDFCQAAALPNNDFAVAASYYYSEWAATKPALLKLAAASGAVQSGVYLSAEATSLDSLDAMAVLPDDQFLVALTPQNSTDVLLARFKYDQTNQPISWAKKLAGSGIETIYGLAARSGGGFIAVGRSNSIVAMQSSYDALLVQVDSGGNLSYTGYGSQFTDDVFRSVVVNPDGTYVVVGSTKSAGKGGWDLWVIKFKASNEIEWSKTYGGRFDDQGYSIAPSGDGGYVVAGNTLSFTAAGGAWLIKLDAAGNPTKTDTDILLGARYDPLQNNRNDIVVSNVPLPGITLLTLPQINQTDEGLTFILKPWSNTRQYP